jgi:DNA-binding MarR family transcriptional regulator
LIRQAEPAAWAGTQLNAVVDGLSALSRVLVGMTVRTLASVDADVTLPQHRTLVLLASRGPQRTVDLARELGVHPSTVTRACDRLVLRGLVRREQRPADRRVSWLTLTEQGRQLLGQVMRRRISEIRKLVDQTPIGDAEAASRLLDALVHASGELPEPQWRQWSESNPPDR